MRSVDARISRRAIALLGLLVASLLLTAALAWQAQRAASSHMAAAQNALRDYGHLAADELSRRIVSGVGYGGYFRFAAFLREADVAGPGDVAARVAAAGPELARAASLARDIVFHDPASGVTSAAPAPATPALAALIERIVAAGGPADAPLAANAYRADDGSGLLIHTATADGRLRAFTVDFASLAPWFDEALDQGPLLPAVLAAGRVTNDVVFLEVAAPDGGLVYRSGDRFDPYLRVTTVMGDDYQGIFAGFTIAASVDPEAAASLVIGGLPRSRLPLLVALIALTLGLLGAAIWLLRREYAVMRLREDFVAQASHELRTPLTQIRMFAETLLLDRLPILVRGGVCARFRENSMPDQG